MGCIPTSQERAHVGGSPGCRTHISAQDMHGGFLKVQNPHLSTGYMWEGPQGAVCVYHSYIIMSPPGKTTLIKLIKALTREATMQLCDHLFTTLDVTAHAGLLPLYMPIMYMAFCHSCHTA